MKLTKKSIRILIRNLKRRNKEREFLFLCGIARKHLSAEQYSIFVNIVRKTFHPKHDLNLPVWRGRTYKERLKFLRALRRKKKVFTGKVYISNKIEHVIRYE